MSENTAISWTNHTFNPWTGCTKVSPGCANCYAEGWAKRSGTVEWGKGKPRRRTTPANWRLPIKWNDAAACTHHCRTCGKDRLDQDCPLCEYEQDMVEIESNRPRVFCASLADWLDDEVPIEWLADLLKLIHETPYLDWLMLTKRPENWRNRMIAAQVRMLRNVGEPQDEYTDGAYSFVKNWLFGNPPSNVWIGTTVEDQQRADERIPSLLKIPAKVRFLSCEPLLEAVNLKLNFNGHTLQRTIGEDIHWVIAGGESGPGFRPFNPDWARSLRDQCKAAGVAFHMKQMGGLRPSSMPPIPDDLAIREWPKGGDQ